MVKSRRNEIIVGAFVLFALGVLIGMTFLIRGSLGMNPYTVEVEYENVAGLEIGSPVLVQGFRTGRVTSMEAGLTEDGEPTVIVICRISRDIPIYRDAQARLMQQGFIGDKRIEIHPGSPGAGEIESATRITGIPSTEMTDLFDEGAVIVDNINAILLHARELLEDETRLAQIDDTLRNLNESSRQINEMIAENRAALRSATANVEDITRQAGELTARLDSILDNAESRVDAIGEESLAAVTELRQSSTDLTRRANALLDDATRVGRNADALLGTTREEVTALSASLQETSRSLNRLLGRVEAGEGTIGQLLADPRPFQDLQSTIARVRGLLDDSESRPYDTRIRYHGAPLPEEAAPPNDGAHRED